jgi:Amt family ammonium transporter
VAPWAAVLIGLAAGGVCYAAVGLKFRFGFDDSLDVVGVHLVGGIVGAMLTGVFAQLVINPAGADGLLFGNAALVGKQLVAVGATIIYSLAATSGILKVVDMMVGLRVSEEDEAAGLDLTQHAEAGYTLGDRGGTHALPEEPAAAPAPMPVGRPLVEMP